MIYLEVQVNLKQHQNFKTHAVNVFNDIIGKKYHVNDNPYLRTKKALKFDQQSLK
jgi:hypothetical protein